MKVVYDREKKSFTSSAKTVKELLKERKITKNSVIVTVNKEVVTEDYAFKKGDTVQILSVVSGG